MESLSLLDQIAEGLSRSKASQEVHFDQETPLPNPTPTFDVIRSALFLVSFNQIKMSLHSIWGENYYATSRDKPY